MKTRPTRTVGLFPFCAVGFYKDIDQRYIQFDWLNDGNVISSLQRVGVQFSGLPLSPVEQDCKVKLLIPSSRAIPNRKHESASKMRDAAERDLLIDVSIGEEGDRRTYIPPVANIERNFAIRLADSNDIRNPASMLIKQRYSWRGYSIPSSSLQSDPETITLVATSPEGNAFGTLGVRLDRGNLLSGEAFPEVVAQKRHEGHKLCEVGSFAVESGDSYVLGALFHTAYIYLHHLHGASYILIEINPRHLGFYTKRLGFSVLSEQRVCGRTQAPAILLGISTSQIETFLTESRLPGDSRRLFLYKYFFSEKEEKGLFERVRALNRPLYSTLVSRDFKRSLF